MLTASLLDGLIDRIGWALLHSVWIGTAAALLLAIVLRAARNAPAGARYVLCCLAMMVTVSTIIGVAGWRQSISQPSATLNANARPHLRSGLPLQTAPLLAPSADVANGGGSDVRAALPIIVRIWLCGVAVIAAWQCVAFSLLARVRREVKPAPTEWCDRLCALAQRMRVRRIALRISDRIHVPVVIGVLRPIVLVPISILTELPAMQVQAILAHELAHVRRFDSLINLIQIAIETLLFYHPAVWWISRQIRRERECACDELAAAVCGSHTTYAQALASLEQLRGPRLALSMRGSGGQGELLVRVRRLLAREQRRPTRSFSGAFAALVIAIALIAASAVNRLAARPLDPTTQPVTPTSRPTRVVERLGLRREYDAGLARMQQASQELSKVNIQIMQMELSYGDGYRPLQQLKAIAAKFDEEYRAAKREVLAIERTAHENGIDLAAPASAPRGPTTREASRVFRFSIGVQDIYLNGKLSDIEAIRRAFDGVPADEKESTRVEVSIATPKVPAGHYFAWKNIINSQATQRGLPPISEVGVEHEPPDGEPMTGEYYMGGAIARPGVYALTARKITLKQALISAGAGRDEQVLITVVRTRGEEITKPVQNLRMSDLFNGTSEDIYLKPYDQVMVQRYELPATSRPASEPTWQPK